MTHNNNAETLLDRYLGNECTPEEKTLVERWYHNVGLEPDCDTSSWAQASKMLFLQQHLPVVRRRLMWHKIQRIAAAAILVLSISTGIYYTARIMSGTQAVPVSYAAVTGPSGLKQVWLPDSTVVWLNANSTLTWTNAYANGQRSVTLSGEACFDVRHDAAHPFVVHTGDAAIKVLGTRFNVVTDAPDALTHVALLRGKVAVQLNNAPQQHLVLAPGEVAACSATAKTLRKYKTDIQPWFSWMSGGFYAEDMSLQQAVEKLCMRYGYKVIWSSRSGGHKHISVAFTRQEFKSMLESLCYLDHLHYTIGEHTVTIR